MLREALVSFLFFKGGYHREPPQHALDLPPPPPPPPKPKFLYESLHYPNVLFHHGISSMYTRITQAVRSTCSPLTFSPTTWLQLFYEYIKQSDPFLPHTREFLPWSCHCQFARECQNHPSISPCLQTSSSPPQRNDPCRAQQRGLLPSWHDGIQTQSLEGRGQVVTVDLWEVLPPEFCDTGVLLAIEGSEDGYRLAITAFYLVKGGLKSWGRGRGYGEEEGGRERERREGGERGRGMVTRNDDDGLTMFILLQHGRCPSGDQTRTLQATGYRCTWSNSCLWGL